MSRVIAIIVIRSNIYFYSVVSRHYKRYIKRAQEHSLVEREKPYIPYNIYLVPKNQYIIKAIK